MKLKHLLIAIGVMLAIGVATACTDNKAISYDELPQGVQNFLKQHFSGLDVQKVTLDRDDAIPEYDIYYLNGTKVEIDSIGTWREISNRTQAVPVTMLPDTMQVYLDQNYKGATILKLEKDHKGYEVTLNNGTELKFSLSGAFLRIDD